MAAAEQRTSNARISAVIAGVTLAATAVVMAFVPRLAVSLSSEAAPPSGRAVGFVNGRDVAVARRAPANVEVNPVAPVGEIGSPAQLPPPGAEQPPDPDGARLQVQGALATLFSGTKATDERLTAVDDRSNVESAMDAVREQYPKAGDTTEPAMGELVFTDPSNAAFLFRLRYTGAPLLPTRVGAARLVDGRWLITRSTLCDVLSAAGHACDPPTPAPAVARVASG